jgi:WD40 repeat protein
MPKIFVSHRRTSSVAITGRIIDRLVGHYGKDSIFFDIDNIPAGVDFRQRINQVLSEADIMIAVVGPKWLGSSKGRNNIHRENDWVRLEIETALRRNALVIPVLVDDAEMPDADQVPESMRDFIYRNAETVASGRDFHIHMDRLFRSIDEMVATPAPVPPAVTDRPAGQTINASAEPAPPPPAVQPETFEVVQQADQIKPPDSVAPFPKFGFIPDVAVPPLQPEIPVLIPQQRRRHLAGALASVAAVIVVLVAGDGWMTHLREHRAFKAASESPSLPVPAPSTPVATPIRTADATSEATLISGPPPPPSQPIDVQASLVEKPPASTDTVVSAKPAVPLIDVPPPLIEKPRVFPDLVVAPKPIPPLGPSCLTRTTRVQPYTDAAGGPLFPVSIRPTLPVVKAVRSVALSPTGREIATAGEDGIIRIWDTASFKLVRTLRGHLGEVYSLDYWIDGSLLASAGVDGTVRLWRPSDGSAVQAFDTRQAGSGRAFPIKQYSVAFYPGTPLKYVLSAGEDGLVRIWNLQNGTVPEKTRDQRNPDQDRSVIRSVSFAPNATGEFVTGGYDGKIRIYLTTKSQVMTLDANAKKVLRTVYSPDSSRIATAGTDGDSPTQNANALKIWSVKTQSFQTLLGHRDYVVSASWSPDGKRLVSGGGNRDRSVILWDADSGQKIAAFFGHQSDVEAVGFFAGGSRIVSVSEDGMIKVWSVPDRKELLTAVGFGEKDYVVYTPAGCYSGSSGIESRFTVSYDNRPAPFNKDALYVPEGFGSLMSGR